MTDGGVESGGEEVDEHDDPRARKDVVHQVNLSCLKRTARPSSQCEASGSFMATKDRRVTI